MTTEFINQSAPYIFGLITTITAYFLGTGKRKSEIQKTNEEALHTHLDNVESALEIYRGMLDKLKSNLDEAEDAYEKAIVEVSILKSENKRLRIRNSQLEKAIRTCNFDYCDDIKKQKNNDTTNKNT
jgi:hypothetical protein